MQTKIEGSANSGVIWVTPSNAVQLMPGVVVQGSIEGVKWNDLDADGIKEAGEPLLSAWGIQLYVDSATSGIVGQWDAGDPLVQTLATGADGSYKFAPVVRGTYFVKEVAQAGWNQTSPDPLDITYPNAFGIWGPLVVNEITSNYTQIDFGNYQTAALGDFVWVDSNANGIQDSGEPGLSGVTVNLLDGSGNLTGKSTTTNASGYYSFTGLMPGSYGVQFTAPAGYVFTGKDQGGDDAKDSDADVATGKTGIVTLTSGQNNLTLDAGLYQYVSLGDFAWVDSNANGVQDSGEPGLSGVTVNLLDSLGNPIAGKFTTTDASGKYLFSGLVPGSYGVQFIAPASYVFTGKDQGGDDAKDSDADIVTGKTGIVTLTSGQTNITLDAGLYQYASLGDFAWVDSNANGIQDSGEPGLSGVTVNLLDGSGNPIAGKTTTTDGSGIYGFANLVPGKYGVQFVAPGGYVFTGKHLGGDDTKDSDADIVTGKTGIVTLTSGENNLTLDAGLYQYASLGDFVWVDSNANGVQDAGEPGLSGVTVNLLDGSGNPIAGKTTTTDGSGIYGFANLVPGKYGVQFVAPGGYVFTGKDVGGNDSIDSDADIVTGKTGIVTLTSGENNLTLDAGLYQYASLGDFAWVDSNANGVQDAGEPGLSGVTVNLLDGSGNPIAGKTTTTDGSGIYGFGNLEIGRASCRERVLRLV